MHPDQWCKPSFQSNLISFFRYFEMFDKHRNLLCDLYDECSVFTISKGTRRSTMDSMIHDTGKGDNLFVGPRKILEAFIRMDECDTDLSSFTVDSWQQNYISPPTLLVFINGEFTFKSKYLC